MNRFDQIHDEIERLKAEHERIYLARKKEGFEIFLQSCQVADLLMNKRGRRAKQ